MRRVLFLAVVLYHAAPIAAKDWPIYRADAARSGYTDEPLAASPGLVWTHRPHHAPHPAWPRDERMDFDSAFAVIVARGRVIFGSSADGAIRALEAATGRESWVFFTDAPVRFAPAAWQDRVFAVSDDGHLYCLRIDDGGLLGKWRGGPADTRILGNSRIISRWPARGGPVIRDDTVYWAAGIWQSEGVFLRAQRAESGEVVWENSQSGAIDMPQPHPTAQAVSGVTAQGYLVADEDQLFVPTGRSVPAAFARTDGKFQYYRLQENGQKGGTQAMTAGTLLYNGGYAFQQSDGQVLPTRVEGAVCQHPQGIVQGLKDQLRVLRAVTKEVADRKGQPTQRLEHELVWELANVPAGTALIAAGDTLISAGENRLAAIDMTNRRVTWTTEVDAPARSLAVSDGRLFVSTVSGAVYCFGGDPSVPSAAPASRPIESRAPQLVAEVVDEIIRTSGITAGYCVDLGCGDGDLTCELIRRTDLYVVAIDADPAKVAATRRKLLDRGVYGARGMVHCGDPQATNYPKYFANLVVSGRSLDSGSADSNTKEALRLQRPYGGVVCMGPPGSMRVTTRGPLDKAGEWTHLYATAANVSCSTDDIHGPLHVLWFRDIDLAMPQRHGRGPAPLFSAGRVFVEGMDAILAVDAYNGLPLWRFELPKVLSAYNADHLAGTAVTGSNFCLEGDSLFVCYQDRCYRLDVATGKKLSTYTLPGTTADEPVTWGYVACEDGVLYGSLANREHIVRHAYLRADDFMKQQYSESKSFCAFDVATGAPLWRYDAAQSIRHNAIAIGGGRVFLIDRPLAAGDLLSRAPDDRRSKTAKPPEHALGKLLALDARSGKPVWNTSTDVYGTMLIYSAAHDLLLSCYQATRFKLPSEAGERMAVYRASTGELVWDREVKYQTRPLLNDRTIIAYPSAADLFSGESRPLDFVKSYGCGQIAGSKNLLLFRSATFGYYDLTRRSGTENFGGIRPGCWLNVLPVGGIVLSPDATTGCKCSYQNRAWMALEGSP